ISSTSPFGWSRGRRHRQVEHPRLCVPDGLFQAVVRERITKDDLGIQDRPEDDTSLHIDERDKRWPTRTHAHYTGRLSIVRDQANVVAGVVPHFIGLAHAPRQNPPPHRSGLQIDALDVARTATTP